MATTTNKFNLTKPELSDAADIRVINANWDKIDSELFKATFGNVITISSSDGISYTATVDGITELYAGLTLQVKPNIQGTNKTPTLNLNNLGAKNIIMPIDGTNTVIGTNGAYNDNWLTVAPLTITYDGTRWRSSVKAQNANSLYGTVTISHGGTGAGTAELARENLSVYSKNEIDTLIGDISSILDEINGEVV